MATRVGINERASVSLKAIRERYPDELEVVAINDLFDAQTNAHLFKYDSNYGIYDGVVEVKDGNLVVDGDVIKVMAEKNPYDLPWSDLKVDIVIDGTGIFRDGKGTPDKPGANAHIDGGGAKKVIITAPASNEDLTVVLGVNEEKYEPEKHHIVRTHPAPPTAWHLLRVVHENFTIKRGLMTTITLYQ